MTRTVVGFVVALALVAAGCDQATVAQAPGGSAPQNGSGKNPDPRPLIDPKLQNDAYHYYGLSRTEPMSLVVAVQGQAPLTGEQTFAYAGVEGGKAKFKVNRTGQLQKMGDEEIWLDDKGITVASTSPGTLEGHPLELPASLTPGTTWKTDYKVTLPTGGSEDHSTYKVVGPAKVTTKAGTFDALLIESTGDDILNGTKVKMNTKSWYVKDRGAVKVVVSYKQATGGTQTMTIEEAPAPAK
ncbi:MAG: hypothetical protein QOJ65_2458 [Fimbriimonadaceae bacterium]|jgi:hypothetical protein|nr:hypothetical protein [Fimbriimonadaceae bacterium]